tara:strand:- start:1510 stop:3507 length:1998 start_codon:yes stop_codon:yes gene_type:complete
MAIVRNAKKQDFDYYLTNIDWDDGTEIDRDIHQFTRNDVFDHTYEKPGFYSVKGLVFKFERVMIDATPPSEFPQGSISVPSMIVNWIEVEADDGDKEIRSKQQIRNIREPLSEFKIRDRFEDTYWVIKHKSSVNHDVRMGTENYISSKNLPASWVNTIVAPITNASSGEQQDGISIQIPIKMDISDIDMIYYSFEVNVANPNGENNPSEYAILERSHPPLISDNGDINPDYGIRFDSARFIEGMGGDSTDPNRDDTDVVKNQGWQTVSGYIFVQEPPSNTATNGSNIENLDFQTIESQIMIFPRRRSDTPQDEDEITYIGLRKVVIRTPNTKNIIRPNEWQRFYSNMIVNPRDDYQSPLYELNDFAMIGGVSEKSSHFKTLTALAAFDNDNKEYKNSSLISGYNPYDFIAIYDTMAKYNADYYNEVLDPYTNPIHEDYAPYWRDEDNLSEKFSLFDKKRIHNGFVDRQYHGVLKDTELVDVDISTTKVYKGAIPIYEHLGVTGYALGNPSRPNYWKNIIPKDYKLTDRSGFSQEPLEDPTKGSITPRIPRLVWVIDEEDDQTWNGGYYWPQLPKMTKGGVFAEPIDEYEYGGRNSLITSDEPIDKTLFNLTFDADDMEELQDITNNYNIEYRVDGLLDLNDDKRVDLITADITDTLEKDFDRQAF